ncbi:MAG: hypothetical protein JXA22_10710 [Candidatus Thermoplasmatota archaeon]|nr:hypothetical protein [Candidatus Thermoplasmatota archaeon]
MVKITVCRTCGSTMSEIWNTRESCVECGGQVDHVEVNMGSIERLPRLLNIMGLILTVLAVIYLLFKLFMDDMGRQEGINIIVLFIGAILLFCVSLLSQFHLFTSARKKAGMVPGPRRQRRMRDQDDGQPIRSGRIEPTTRRTASKVPLNRK